MATTSNFGTEQEWAQPDPFGGTTAADRARNLVRARRHTRVVQALRFSLPGAAAGIVVLYFAMIIDTTGWVGGFPKLEMPRILPDNLTMDNPSYEGFNKDGGKYVVRAKTAIQDLVNTEFVRLNDITGDMTDANKSKTNLTAAKGEFNTKTNQLELTGGIDIVADSGLKAKLSTATIQTNENIITSKEPVLVEMPSGTIRSNEMRILSKSREIAFVNDVKAHLVPPKPDAAAENAPTPAKPPATPMFGGGEGPIDITANRLDIDDTDKTATFTGNVKARQGDAAMATAALEVQYEGGETGAAGSAPAATTPGAGTKIKRIFSKSPVVMTRAPQDRVTGASFDYDAVKQVAVVDGDVEMTSGADRSATGDRATVDQQADTILLTGSVVAIQGRNQLKGERLFVERATGTHAAFVPPPPARSPGASRRASIAARRKRRPPSRRCNSSPTKPPKPRQRVRWACSRPTPRHPSTSKPGGSTSTIAPSRPSSRATCAPCRATSSFAHRSCAPTIPAPPGSPKRTPPATRRLRRRSRASRHAAPSSSPPRMGRTPPATGRTSTSRRTRSCWAATSS